MHCIYDYSQFLRKTDLFLYHNKKEMTRICCIYLRCSTNEQARGGYSLEYQEEKCKEYIQKKEFAYFKTYTDAGVSGTVPAEERGGMSHLFRDMKLNKFDTIVFHAFDRLARTMTVAYEIVGMFEKYNITIAECQHDIDTSTGDGRNRMAIFFTFAQMEHDTTKERSKLGRDAKKKEMGWIGGPVPYGYMKEKKNKDNKDTLPVINPEEAKNVNLIYDLYWKDNYPVSKIPELLNSQKVNCGKYNKNTGWNVTMVKRILKNHKDKYEGGIINGNESGYRWSIVLNDEYPTYPRAKKKTKGVKVKITVKNNSSTEEE